MVNRENTTPFWGRAYDLSLSGFPDTFPNTAWMKTMAGKAARFGGIGD